MAGTRQPVPDDLQHKEDKEAYAEMRRTHLERIFGEYEKDQIRWLNEASWRRDAWD